ncbi:hypothetical protein LNQ03_07425 [Klebsiella pneumoniae subsp. pneumoniae]|nr:hypothetical protein [Klebsiella pneumoniae subsp. pneumoniae]
MTHTVNPRLSVDHLRYIPQRRAADEVLFLTRPFFAAGSAAAAAAADGENTSC